MCDSKPIEVIEDLVALRDVEVSLRLPKAATMATLEPQGKEIPLTMQGDRVKLRLDEFTCHQMVVFHY